MQSTQNYQYTTENNSVFTIHAVTMLGDREEQQDCYGYELLEKEGLAVLCDGMGGHQGGSLASTLAVSQMLGDYINWTLVDQSEDGFAPIHLRASAQKANDDILSLKNSQGEALNAGSTLTAVYIRDNRFYWCSTGDTRGYLYRRNEMVQFTVDHNYGTVLLEQKTAGVIDDVFYDRNSKKSEALVSYLGVGNKPLFDENELPVSLLKGDIICLCTDGLYRLLSDEAIKRILQDTSCLEDALRIMQDEADRGSKALSVRRDNMSVILIKIQEGTIR